jgi:hypothetical protein
MRWYFGGVPPLVIARREKVTRQAVHATIKVYMRRKVFGHHPELTAALNLLRTAGISGVPAIQRSIRTGKIRNVRRFGPKRVAIIKRWLKSKR